MSKLQFKDSCASIVNADVNRSKHKDGGEVRGKHAAGGMSEVASAMKMKKKGGYVGKEINVFETKR